MVTLNALRHANGRGGTFWSVRDWRDDPCQADASGYSDQSLTIFDRGFLAGELLHTLCQTGQARHFLVPAKANTKWKIIEGTMPTPSLK